MKAFFATVQSVLAAFIGVQKKEKLRKDFSSKSAMPFIVSGIILALMFVLIVVTVVQIVLANA